MPVDGEHRRRSDWAARRIRAGPPRFGRDRVTVHVREMTVADLDELIDMQEAGAVLGLSAVFPQDRFPFPRDAVLARWRAELEDSEVGACVACDDDQRIIGFAATRGAELLHFGTAVDTWGTGTAAQLLEAVVRQLRSNGFAELMLRVFADNTRARRFYAKHGWVPTGASAVSSFEPFPTLLEYVLHDV